MRVVEGALAGRPVCAQQAGEVEQEGRGGVLGAFGEEGEPAAEVGHAGGGISAFGDGPVAQGASEHLEVVRRGGARDHELRGIEVFAAFGLLPLGGADPRGVVKAVDVGVEVFGEVGEEAVVVAGGARKRRG